MAVEREFYLLPSLLSEQRKLEKEGKTIRPLIVAMFPQLPETLSRLLRSDSGQARMTKGS